MGERRAKVYFRDRCAGEISQDDDGYVFRYDPAYCALPDAVPVSLTLPVRPDPYRAGVLFSFFDGLIPEGWLLDIAAKNWKVDPRDRMGLLMCSCKDCIGAVSIVPVTEAA